jgi:hypothetical protein
MYSSLVSPPFHVQFSHDPVFAHPETQEEFVAQDECRQDQITMLVHQYNSEFRILHVPILALNTVFGREPVRRLKISLRWR